MREDVDRQRLHRFLEALGREFPSPARLVLCGGESLVLRGLRGTTRDVDIAYDVAPADHGRFVAVLRELKDRLSVNVEEAQPADFIPLPPGSRDRDEFIARHGSVDVYLADPYAIALSKISRGHARDLEDVRAMLGAQLIEPSRLRSHAEAILPAYAAMRVRNDPARFRRMLDEVVPPVP